MTTKTLATISHGNRKYPWEKWQDGKTHQAVQGRHFACSPEKFRHLLTSRASRRGLKVSPRVKGDVVWFQFGEGK